MKRTIRIGTRKSRLAVVQTNIVIDRIKEYAPELEFEIIPISTVGDEILDKPLIQFGGKGIFVDAFEEALLNRKIDLAVHSAKDMTMQLPEGLGIIGIPKREDPRDVLITRKEEQPSDKRLIIGTSSLRRQFQIEQFYDCECKSLRGNVPTRLDKLKNGEYDAIILAAAGLKRLGLMEEEEFSYRFFPSEEFVPAAGQGILAIEGRVDDDIADVVRQINDADTVICLKTERRVLELLEAGCHEAIGIYSFISDRILHINAIYQMGNELRRVKEQGLAEDYPEAAALVAKRLRS